MVDAIERAVATPQDQIVMHRALRRQVLGQRTPLTTCAQDIHDAIHHITDVDRALVAAALGGRDVRRDQRPLLIGQIARIAQATAIIAGAVFGCPMRARGKASWTSLIRNLPKTVAGRKQRLRTATLMTAPQSIRTAPKSFDGR